MYCRSPTSIIITEPGAVLPKERSSRLPEEAMKDCMITIAGDIHFFVVEEVDSGHGGICSGWTKFQDPRTS
jgi:hypothetical protein